MILVDECRVLGTRRLDPRPGRLGTGGVQSHGDDLEASSVQLRPQFLPHGQV
jgi:hypothetical protein